MHLTDARLAQVEPGADLLHRHVLVVVEDDDETLVTAEAARGQAQQVAVLEAARWRFGLLVFQNFNGEYVIVAVGLVPFLLITPPAPERS